MVLLCIQDTILFLYMSTMKILVTGGGGFLGSEIVHKLLHQGHNVVILGRTNRPELAALGVEIHIGSLGDRSAVLAACKGCDAVFHVAAQAGVWGSWQSYYATNVQGTHHVIDGCREQSVPYLVYTSTPSVVFNGQPFCGENESLPYGRNWLCHYAYTKALAEQAVLAAHEPGKLQVCALRPHLIWGVGDPHIVPRIIERAHAGRLAIIGDGKNRVDITHVNNAAQAHLLALAALQQGRAGGRAFFISQGTPVYLWDWIRELLARVGAPPIQKTLSLRKAYAVGTVMEWLWKGLRLSGEPPMTRFVAVELGKDHFFNIQAAREALSYAPEMTTEAGLDTLVPWVQEYLNPLHSRR